MNEIEIKRRLVEIGYPRHHLDIVSKELLSVSSQLRPIVEKWLSTGAEEDYSVYGFSILGLCKYRDLKYPAAILTIDWLIKEPEIAISHINNKRR